MEIHVKIDLDLEFQVVQFIIASMKFRSLLKMSDYAFAKSESERNSDLTNLHYFLSTICMYLIWQDNDTCGFDFIERKRKVSLTLDTFEISQLEFAAVIYQKTKERIGE